MDPYSHLKRAVSYGVVFAGAGFAMSYLGGGYSAFLFGILIIPLWIGYFIFAIIKTTLNVVPVSGAGPIVPGTSNIRTMFWIVIIGVIYLVVGLFSEWEFLPNPFWIISPKPPPGPSFGSLADLFALMAIGILFPLIFALRSPKNKA